MPLIAPRALAGSGSFASPGLADVKSPHPVRAGDLLTLRTAVLDLEATSLFDLAPTG